MALSHSPSIVTDGLVLCLDAANRKSYPGTGTGWTDLSGNNINGTLVNGTNYSTNNLGSLVFDGTDDYVNCGSPSSLNFGTNNFNLSCWINTPSSSGPDWVGIISRFQLSISAGYWIQLDPTNRYVGFGWEANQWITSSTSVGGGQWKFISCQRTGSTSAEVYINQVLDGSSSTLSNISSDGQQIDIGRLDYQIRYFSGNISYVSMYNRALSQQEISQNFNALRGRFGI